MDKRLRWRVPATPALLEGWCGPVIAHVYAAPEPCVLVRPSVLEMDDGFATHYALHIIDGEAFDTAPYEDLDLDLSRDECFDRVRRVLGVMLGLEPGAVDVVVTRLDDGTYLVAVGDRRTTRDFVVDLDAGPHLVARALAAVWRKVTCG